MGIVRLLMPGSNYAKEPVGLFTGLVIVFIWASWYVISRWGVLGSLTPADVTFLRYAGGTAITLPFLALWKGKRIPWKLLPALTLTFGFPYAFGVFMGLNSSPAANAGILLNGLLPVVSAVFAWFFFHQGVGKRKWVAIAVLAGSNLLMLYAGLDDRYEAQGLLWILFSTLLLGLYMNIVRKWHVDMVVLIPVMSLANLVCYVPFWLLLETNIANASFYETSVQALFQGAVNQVLVVWLLAFTIRKIGSVSTSVLLGFVPATTAIIAWLVLAERPNPIEALAILGCTAGIVAFARAEGSKAAAKAAGKK